MYVRNVFVSYFFEILWKSSLHLPVYAHNIPIRCSITREKQSNKQSGKIGSKIEINFSIFHTDNNTQNSGRPFAFFLPLNGKLNFLTNFVMAKLKVHIGLQYFGGIVYCIILEGIMKALCLFSRKLLMNTFRTYIVSLPREWILTKHECITHSWM